ncbi:MAG: bifunctional demethylmenaquinone methyltransferase/2-methoxy-6-polyprenyl-1,4-benzoquinol methylase UbiE [Nitrospirales bacterium]|nr:bifunctional demethylmenaquinone methyltransferase/2-methoxy-6-polyprenyl-1,4-benzoquinol methylase UbiE [Nitrospirales bacterium]
MNKIDIPGKAASTWTGPAREQAVQRMFTAIAKFYDLNNSLLSFGLHHSWKRKAISYIPDNPGTRALDLGAGTCDLAILVDQHLRNTSQIIAADLNLAMLRVGQDKVRSQNLASRITCLQMNAEHLTFPPATFETVTAGFCIRNVGNLPQALSEICRVLQPGGRFVCLEFSRPVSAGLRKLYDWYSFHLLPWIGTKVARDGTGVYEYLPASIRNFPDQTRLAQLLKEAGFQSVDYHNLTGGIVAIHVAVK